VSDLHTVISGEGPMVLFVHGLGCTGAFWTDVIGRLEGSSTCVAVDLDGFGASPPLPDGMQIADWAARLEELLVELAPGRPVVAVGHSLGGMVIQELVLRAPAAIAGVVLANTIAGATDHVREINGTLAGLAQEGGSVRLAEAMAGGLFGPAPLEGTDRARARFAEQCGGTDPHSLVGGLRAIMAFDARPRLAQVAVPALVVTGEYEGNRADQDVLVDALPEATLLVMAGAGHMAPAEDPGTFAAALTGFLARLA
jgi:3-oxoadipate enol-lactonase